jgi:hypothetical protein
LLLAGNFAACYLTGRMPDPSPSGQPLAPTTQPTAPSYTSLLDELNVQAKQRELRKALIHDIEKIERESTNKTTAFVAYIAQENAPGSGLIANDVPIIGNVLLKLGDVDSLSLLLHSPGGDGTAVEQLITICRAQCKRLRVVIPNRAKSAATMIALGADEIVMGYASELGPIDAQIPVIIDGHPQYMSAQSFIDARDKLVDEYYKAIGATPPKDPQPILQMIASLNSSFIVECERMMDFGRDVVRKLLSTYMFKKDKDKAAKDAKINHIVEMLSSVQMHLVHGRAINGRTARSDLKLNVKLPAKDDPFWKKVWEYYTRSELFLGMIRSPKMFESREEILTITPQMR